MWSVWRSITRRPDVPDHLPLRNMDTRLQPIGIAFEMRVVVTVVFRRIELINREPTRLAGEQGFDRAFFNGKNRCVASSKDVRCLVLPATVTLVIKGVVHVGQTHVLNWHSQ